ncbi:MAG: YjjG family noncanonical pyrimidine nucleotidase [Saprospiraceae bacterium]|jgi:YjjG family noncanonical pyrimidine nucleotidase
MNKYEWLLFDIDNTLLDFSKASKESLFKTFLDHDMVCTEEIYKTYNIENAKVWIDFENKKIDTETLKRIRFAGFFDLMGINKINPFDFNTAYIENMVAVSEAYTGAVELIQKVSSNHRVSIITNGLKEAQRPRLARVGMIEMFDSIVVSDEIGVAKPDVRFFEYTYNSIPNPPDKSKILVVGDNLMSDIRGGQNFGVDTCWVSHKKENLSNVKPTFMIDTVFEIESVLLKGLKS